MHSVAAGGAGEVTELWIGGGRLHSSLRDSGSMVRSCTSAAGSRCFDQCFPVALLGSAITKNLLAEAEAVVTKGGYWVGIPGLATASGLAFAGQGAWTGRPGVARPTRVGSHHCMLPSKGVTG